MLKAPSLSCDTFKVVLLENPEPSTLHPHDGCRVINTFGVGVTIGIGENGKENGNYDILYNKVYIRVSRE